MSNECAAGRTAFFGGRWTVPCPITGRHRVGSGQGDGILLCDDHFRQVSELQKGNDAPPVNDSQQANDFQQVNEAVAAKDATLGEGEFYRSEKSAEKNRKRRFRLFGSR